MGQEVLESGHESRHGAAGGGPSPDGGGLDGGHAARDVVGERNRRAIRGARQGLGGADRDECSRFVRRRHLGRLEGDHRVASRAVRGDEPMVEVLHRGLRMKRDHRVLQLIGPEPGHHVRRDEHERIAHRDLAAPDVRLEAGRREAALAVRIGQRGQASLPDEVGLGRSDRRHVHLVATDNGDPDPDRTVVVRSVQAEPLALMAESLVRRCDRLLDADPDPSRFVVVVLATDRLGGELRCLLGARGRDRRGHDQVEMALRPGDRADARLDDHDRVGRVGGAIGLGDHAELHLQSDGQVRVSRG
jgi:hypothetical protein